MNAIKKNTALCALSMALPAVTAAQDLIPKAAPQARPVLIRHATLHTVSGEVLEDADLLFDKGVIRGVGPEEIAGENGEEISGLPEVIDATGKHVYPGFVCAASTLGLTEIGSVDMTIDTSEAGSLNPEVYAAVAVNPDSWLIPVARRNGILTAGVFPQGGLVPGRISVMALDGWTWEDMAIVPDAGLAISWPFMGSGGRRFGRFGGGGGGGAEKRIAELDSLLDSAQAYLAAREADPSVKTDLRFECMAPTLAGETPIYVNATTAEQIESAVSWAVERGLKIVVIGGRDALECSDLLQRHDVPVVLTAVHRMPHRRDLSYASTYELPARLEEAGVRWCLTMPARSSSSARNLPYEAAACVGYGLDPEVALRSITLSAAECLGLGAELGSLDVGKRATLFIADGDPFELTTKIEAAYIDGRKIDLRDKQTELAAKYREKYRQLGKIPSGE